MADSLFPPGITDLVVMYYDRDKLLELVREAGFELVRVETFLVRDNIYILRTNSL